MVVKFNMTKQPVVEITDTSNPVGQPTHVAVQPFMQKAVVMEHSGTVD